MWLDFFYSRNSVKAAWFDPASEHSELTCLVSQTCHVLSRLSCPQDRFSNWPFILKLAMWSQTCLVFSNFVIQMCHSLWNISSLHPTCRASSNLSGPHKLAVTSGLSSAILCIAGTSGLPATVDMFILGSSRIVQGQERAGKLLNRLKSKMDFPYSLYYEGDEDGEQAGFAVPHSTSV